jgi:photosystem I subunit X
LFTSSLFAIAVRTSDWSPIVSAIMIVCNLVAFAFGRATINKQNSGPAAGLFLGMGLPALLGVTSLGHVLGAGVILGLTNIGAL